MLPAQVSYWTLQETKRHNLVTEQLGFDTLNENIRHNVETENLGYGNLAENTRHNMASESLGWSTLLETKRHNLEYEGIMQYSNKTDRLNASTRVSELNQRITEFDQKAKMDFINYGNDVNDTQSRSEQAAASTSQAESSASQAKTSRFQTWINLGKAAADTLIQGAKTIAQYRNASGGN